MQIPTVGTFGYHAAKTYQAVSQPSQHQTTVQYTADIQAKGASHELFQYAQTFAQNPDKFSAQEIQAASGLNLAKLASPEKIIDLWDTTRDGAVDLKEAFIGLLHLDFSDGKLDGKITQANRNQVETQFFDAGIRQRITPVSTFLDQIAETTAQQVALTDDNTTQRLLRASGTRTQGDASNAYETHAQTQIDEAQTRYRDQFLTVMADAHHVLDLHQHFQCACGAH